ncbi:sensor domain-containing diguanylate cyclase [Pseudoalteromonas sp. OOF1S-7]|uniref:GGDEF domain-containing protein n=1 Tax=Pseudoalteromonas sp. OOF1S-7 TaxID=2917757 RepID=UPI001EF5E87E|nr:sensor domain-containing diguanylate cyclase [Pseudoalteromonas sp. OOF1S-7]MCG7533605.1 sensor domain-containing diguanylate cyclase [Pseudoalteromonas sp. OOF1S-7]
MHNRYFFTFIATLAGATVLANVVMFYISDDANEVIAKFEQHWQQQADIILREAELLDELERQLSHSDTAHRVKDYRPAQLTLEADAQTTVAMQIVAMIASLDLSETERQALEQIKRYLEQISTNRTDPTVDAPLSHEYSEQLQLQQHQQLDSALQSLRSGMEARIQITRHQHQAALESVINKGSIEAWLLLSLVVILACAGAVVLRAQLRTIEERACLFDAIPDALLYCEYSGRITRVNQSCTELFGYADQELLQMTVEDLIPVRFRELHSKERRSFTGRAQMRRKGQNGLNIVGLHKSGEEIPLDIAIARTVLGQEPYFVAVIRDIRPELQLQQKAELDFLTQVYNRGQIEQILKDELSRAHRYQRPLSVMMVDIDKFKTLNDTLGHQVGDAALAELSAFLTGSIRPSDSLGRWGGDEFVLICPEIDAEKALQMAQRLVVTYREQNHYDLSLSIGVASRPQVGAQTDVEHLIGEADDALYQAKAAGRSRAVQFSGD